MQTNEKHTKEPLLIAEEDENTFGRVTFRRICTQRDKYLVELSLNSNYEYPEEAERNKATAYRLVSAYNATAGIPTAELEAGIIGEFAPTMKDVITAAEIIDGSEAPTAEDIEYLLASIRKARALLARLEGR